MCTGNLTKMAAAWHTCRQGSTTTTVMLSNWWWSSYGNLQKHLILLENVRLSPYLSLSIETSGCSLGCLSNAVVFQGTASLSIEMSAERRGCWSTSDDELLLCCRGFFGLSRCLPASRFLETSLCFSKIKMRRRTGDWLKKILRSYCRFFTDPAVLRNIFLCIRFVL